LAEDIPEITFYTKEDAQRKALWCRDKYYHNKNYTFAGEIFEYTNMY
jgi:hypothetical protein